MPMMKPTSSIPSDEPVEPMLSIHYASKHDADETHFVSRPYKIGCAAP